MDVTGGVIKSLVWIDPKRCDRRALKRWLELAERYVGTLPPKEK